MPHASDYTCMNTVFPIFLWYFPVDFDDSIRPSKITETTTVA